LGFNEGLPPHDRHDFSDFTILPTNSTAL
jgi:hypothetical protein